VCLPTQDSNSREAAMQAFKIAANKEEEEEARRLEQLQQQKAQQQRISRFLETLDALGQVHNY